MSSLFVLPKQAPTYGGANYASAKFYLFNSGTLTPAVTYQDADLTTPHAHPVVADGGGVFEPIWLDPSSAYRVQLKTFAGTLVYDVDPYPGTPFDQDSLGRVLYPRTDAEIAAGVTPTYYYYEPGYVPRYGTGTTAVQAAIDQNNADGAEVLLAPGTESVDTLTIYGNVKISGHGTDQSVLSYTGSGALFSQSTPGTRIYNIVMRDFSMTDAGTGTIALDLDSVSSGEFENLKITGFTTGVKVYSPVAGYAVYNRFWSVKVQSATTGFRLHGTSSNANVFLGCRTNICTTGVLIEDSNDNSFSHSQFESGGGGISITASIAGISPRNYIAMCRFEGNSGTNIVLGTNVSETALFANFHADGTSLSDSGTRTQIFDAQSTKSRLKLQDASVSTDGPAFTFTRSTAAGSSVPVMQINDTNTGSGTPNTLEINSERNAGKSLTIKRAAAEQFSVTPAGVVSSASKIYPGTDAAALQTAAGIYAGSGAPNNANGTNGDFYLRSDGTQAGNTVIYHREGGAWVALVTT